MLFEIGQTVATSTAVTTLAEAGVTPQSLLERHHRGDWGNVSQDDWQANERALIKVRMRDCSEAISCPCSFETKRGFDRRVFRCFMLKLVTHILIRDSQELNCSTGNGRKPISIFSLLQKRKVRLRGLEQLFR